MRVALRKIQFRSIYTGQTIHARPYKQEVVSSQTCIIKIGKEEGVAIRNSVSDGQNSVLAIHSLPGSDIINGR